MIEDKYKINDYLHIIGDAKFDKYQRNADLDNSIENLYKLGFIFVPNDNLGFKLFASQSYMSPTFYYVDMASPDVNNLESQKINYYSLENAYTYNSNKFDLILKYFPYLNIHSQSHQWQFYNLLFLHKL